MCYPSGDCRDPGVGLGSRCVRGRSLGCASCGQPGHRANHLAPSPASSGRSDGAPLDLPGSASPNRYPRPGGHVPRTRRGRRPDGHHDPSSFDQAGTGHDSRGIAGARDPGQDGHKRSIEPQVSGHMTPSVILDVEGVTTTWWFHRPAALAMVFSLSSYDSQDDDLTKRDRCAEAGDAQGCHRPDGGLDRCCSAGQGAGRQLRP